MKSHPKPSFLQAEQCQLFHPFLTGQMPQSLNHLYGLLLDSLHYVHVSLVLRSPELATRFQMWSHQCRVEGKDHFPWPTSNNPPNAAQNTINFFLLQGHIPCSCSTWCSPGPSDPFQQSCLCWGQLGRILVWGCSSPSTIFYHSHCWTSRGCCQTISPACWRLSGWQHKPLVYQPLFPFLCHLQTCWRYTLSRYPDH